MKTQLTAHRKEKGQSLVELAMSFTLLLLILTGVIDLGSMYYTYTALQDTTQEGAIYASMHPTSTTAIQDHIKQSAAAPIYAPNLTDITVQCGGAACVTSTTASCQGQKITVSVGYIYKLSMPLIPTVIGRQNVTLQTTVTATIIQSPATIAALAAQTPSVTCP
jgi:Flp pilus assembly protein TadG